MSGHDDVADRDHVCNAGGHSNIAWVAVSSGSSQDNNYASHMTMGEILCYYYMDGYQLSNKVMNLLRSFYFSSKSSKFGDN